MNTKHTCAADSANSANSAELVDDLQDLAHELWAMAQGPQSIEDGANAIAHRLQAWLDTRQPAQADRNMEGADEFVRSLLINGPLWPNAWGQDVAAAAFALTDHGRRTTAWPAIAVMPELPETATLPAQAPSQPVQDVCDPHDESRWPSCLVGLNDYQRSSIHGLLVQAGVPNTRVGQAGQDHDQDEAACHHDWLAPSWHEFKRPRPRLMRLGTLNWRSQGWPDHGQGIWQLIGFDNLGRRDEQFILRQVAAVQAQSAVHRGDDAGTIRLFRSSYEQGALTVWRKNTELPDPAYGDKSPA